MGITLRELSIKAQVDVSTVSRALRNDPRVNPETKKRIQRLARRNAYVPNLAAQYLQSRRTNTIWLILPGLESLVEQQPAQAACRYLKEKGFDLLIAVYNRDPGSFERIITKLEQGIADGGIVVPMAGVKSQCFERLIQQKYPLVFLDRHLPELDLPVVTSSNDEGTRKLMEKAYQAGCRDFVSLFSETNTVEISRGSSVRGFCRENHCHLSIARPPNIDLSGPSRILTILGSSQSQVQGFIHDHFKNAEGTRLFGAVFDQWTGTAAPVEKVFICIQDFQSMAEKAAQIILDQLDKKKKFKNLFNYIDVKKIVLLE